MSEAFPNPYDPPAERAEPRAQPFEDEDEELSRAIRESLALEAEAKERARREEQEALQVAIAASRDEESRRREREQQALEQERKALEQSRQEARRREAEMQRQALLEMEILEQSRREHEAAMQFREFREPPQPQRRSTIDRNAEESLLWLDAPRGSSSGSTRSSATSVTPTAAASSSGRTLDHADPGPPPSYTPRESMHSPRPPTLPTPPVAAPPAAPPAPERQESFPNPYELLAAPQPPAGADTGRAPLLNPFLQDERALSPTQMPAASPSAGPAEPDSPSSSSSFTVSSTASHAPPELPPPPQSRYEAALAAAAAAEQQDAESEDSWAESTGDERLWRAPVHDEDEEEEEEEYDASTRTAYDEALARSNVSLDGTAPNEGLPTAASEEADDDEAHRIPIAPLVPTQVPIAPLQPRRWSEERELRPTPADAPDAEASPASAYALDAQPWTESPAPSQAADAASLRSQDRSSSRASSERRPGVFGEAFPPENASGQPALRGVQFGFADSPYALELYATPTASAPLYARPDLSLDPHVPAPPPGSVEEHSQLFFPERVTLASGPGRVWFAVRTYSWKVLLQALAWYGHAVMGAAAPGARLQPEIAFCMPRRVEAPHVGAPTFVSLAMGLAAGPALPAASIQPLEAYAARLGGAITPVSLAQHAVALPTDLMTFAQTLFSAPQLSSAPALRELRQTIARHDEWLLTRRDELVLRARAHAGQPSAGALDRAEALEWSLLQHQLSLLQPPGAPVGAPVESPVDALPSGHREHFRQRVRKKLARWGGGHARDEDLATWITPYDLAQHGHAPADPARDASPMPR